MAGLIEVQRGQHWSANGWLFDWTLTFLADNVTDREVEARIREVVEENLGWLSLDDYGGAVQLELRDLLGDRLLPAADASLPTGLVNRDAALALLRQLADKARVW